MRVMIVDDEVVIREGLRALIDWKAAGFSEIVEAKNAIEAIDKIECEPPDLIITDIFMPEMSGLEFARSIRDRYPSIRFVILTGYEKFEYAKEAISIGVAKYMVKPIFPDELKQTVEELRDEIAAERRNLNWTEAARKRLNEYKPIIAEKFWNDVLRGALSHAEGIPSHVLEAEIRVQFPAYACVAVQMTRLAKIYRRYGEHELALVRFAIRNILEEMWAESLVYISDYSETVLLCLLSIPAEPEVWKQTTEVIESTLKIDICVGAGRACSELVQVHQSATEALNSVKYLEMLDQTGFIRCEEIPAWKKDHMEYPYEEEKHLMELLRYGERLPEQALEPFFRRLVNQNFTPAMIHLACVQLLGALYRLADEYDIGTLPSFNESVLRLEGLSSILQKQQLVLEWLHEIVERKNSLHADFVTQLVDQAKHLIKERFSDPSLSVVLIAQVLCITPNYLSRIFRQKTGQTCVEYMTECRLEEAKRLLAFTTYKNYDIADKVGYTNAHYFSFIFKKNVGCSPTDYRDRIGGTPL